MQGIVRVAILEPGDSPLVDPEFLYKPACLSLRRMVWLQVQVSTNIVRYDHSHPHLRPTRGPHRTRKIDRKMPRTIRIRSNLHTVNSLNWSNSHSLIQDR